MPSTRLEPTHGFAALPRRRMLRASNPGRADAADGALHATGAIGFARGRRGHAVKYANGLFVLGSAVPTDGAWACSACAPAVRARLHDADFLLNLALVISPAALVGVLAWWLCAGDAAEGSA